MSFRVRDINTIQRNQLNKSSSKQQYTFTRQKRFSEVKKNQDYKYYEIPSTKDNRAASFSMSQRKFPVTSKQEQLKPSPDKYNPKDIKLTKDMISFGPGRQSCKIDSFIKINDTPGPGAYEVKFNNLYSQSSKYSISKKYPAQKNQKSQNPGPGCYAVKDWLQKSKILSTEKYRGGTVITNPIKDKNGRLIITRQIHDTPIYNIQKSYKGNETFSKTGASFGKSLRFRERIKTENPGPGSYQRFSQFI